MDPKTLRVCIDRPLPAHRLAHHVEQSCAINPDNRPEKMAFAEYGPASLAILVGKLWRPGTTLGVKFLDGDPWIHDKVLETAKIWESFGNFHFERVKSGPAPIRVSFLDNGSWSYIGTESESVPISSPTMNFGWLTRQSTEAEYHRVVLHEFGHALGAIHEHQSPAAGTLPWNKEAVYAIFGASPNFWSREMVDQNIFDRYSRTETNYTSFDPRSIMMYRFPRELFSTSYETPENDALSDLDKQFIRSKYPTEVQAMGIFAREGALREQLRSLNLQRMTPLEALDALSRLQSLATGAEISVKDNGAAAAATALR